MIRLNGQWDALESGSRELLLSRVKALTVTGMNDDVDNPNDQRHRDHRPFGLGSGNAGVTVDSVSGNGPRRRRGRRAVYDQHLGPREERPRCPWGALDSRPCRTRCRAGTKRPVTSPKQTASPNFRRYRYLGSRGYGILTLGKWQLHHRRR